MRRPWVILGILLLVGFGVWLSLGISSVFSAERDLFTRLDAIVTYYESMDQTYVKPLQAHPDLSPGDSAALQDVSEKLQELPRAKNHNEKVDLLLAAQAATIGFFTTPGFPESFSSDPLYIAWNRNASNVGEASALIRDYNEALSLYNARLETPVGSLAAYWRSFERREYLGIDGKTQRETLVTF